MAYPTAEFKKNAQYHLFTNQGLLLAGNCMFSIFYFINRFDGVRCELFGSTQCLTFTRKNLNNKWIEGI